MTLGIAIPTYNGHMYNLENLLHQISNSTVIPQQVSVSISSLDYEFKPKKYPFELICTTTNEFKNVSQNCNISASKLSTDIISFFGGDDIPHIKRNEYLIKSFENGCDAVVHDYIINPDRNLKEFVSDIGELDFYLDYIDSLLGENYHPHSNKEVCCYAGGPISVRNEIFQKYKYNEDNSIFKSEDAVYNSTLVKNGVKISYIRNPLMIYIH
jgi:hypothetical protein